MPTVARPLVEGGRVHPGHEHSWMGAGIAKTLVQMDSVRAGYRSGYDVKVQARRSITGGDVQIDAVITNARAGHDLPTGDPEHFITLDLNLFGNGSVSLWSHTERIGELWEWDPEAKQVSDNSIKPGERREFHYIVPPLSRPNAGLTLEVIARNHRMTEENARIMGVHGRYPLSVETVRRIVSVVETK
jgi:hypothetical protein